MTLSATQSANTVSLRKSAMSALILSSPGGGKALLFGNWRAGSVYYTTGDTIKVIEPDALELVVNTAVQVIRRLDS